MVVSRGSDPKIYFFASHRWRYSHHRDGLHGLLSPWQRGIDFEDYSVSRWHPLQVEDDPELARHLRDRIRCSDALLIMAGMYALDSPWMQFEIHMAIAFDVPIIPIIPNGQERIPRAPLRFARSPVRWRGESVRQALLACISEQRREARTRAVNAVTGPTSNLMSGLLTQSRPSLMDGAAARVPPPQERPQNALFGSLVPPAPFSPLDTEVRPQAKRNALLDPYRPGDDLNELLADIFPRDH